MTGLMEKYATRNEIRYSVAVALNPHHPWKVYEGEDMRVERSGRFQGTVTINDRPVWVNSIGKYFTDDDPSDWLEFQELTIELDEYYFNDDLPDPDDDENWLFDNKQEEIKTLVLAAIQSGDITLDGEPINP
jgi:hypothetical protein